jgi:hypothetical protein
MRCDLEVLIRLSLILARSTSGRQANSPLFEIAGSDGFGDSYVGWSGFWPDELFFVVNGRVRKPFPLRGGSV